MRLIIFFLLLNISAEAQIGMGQWRLHVPANRALDVVSVGNSVFAAYTNAVIEYDTDAKEISVWDAVNSLSDITVSCLGKSNDGAIFVGYTNGNLDKIKDNKVTNIPAIKLAQIPGSKQIHRIVENGPYVYLATGFAIVVIDPVKNEVKDTYYPTNGNDPLIDLAFANDSIYVLGEDRLFVGAMSNQALADPAQWTVDTRVPVLTSLNKYNDIERFNNDIYLVESVDGYGLDTVFHLTDSGLDVPFIEGFPMEIASIRAESGYLTVSYFNGSVFYDQNFTSLGSFNSYSFGNAQPNEVTKTNGKYYIADEGQGLVEYNNATDNQRIAVSGPPKNDFYALDWHKGKLAAAGGGISEVSSTFNSSGIYLFEDENWELRDVQTVSSWTSGEIWDFVSISLNRNNTDVVAVGTYSKQPLSILDKSGQAAAVFTPSNSPIEATMLGNGWSYISDVKYDDQDNLWVVNGYTNEPLRVYTKDGNWYSFDLGPSAKNKFTKRMEIDYNGNKWIAIKGVGLVGYRDNETIANAADDKYVLLNSGETSGALPSNEVNTVAVDFDNEIWIGTDNGFAVLYNSDGAFDASPGDYNAQRIKLEFEGNVEYVLGATNITDIEVDGANRKWFGTANAGVLLLSADGLEILEHHTVENSPLISNVILDMEIDHNTGEMFIITDKGLVSYRTDATYEDPDYSDVTVFPNPARPDFDGPISIQGIRYNSDVKITDIAGNLVYQTTSNGGTATWDGRTLQGEKVATGVYLIWTAANEGKGRYVGKVLVVN